MLNLTLENPVVEIYAKLIGYTLLGFCLGKFLPKVIPTYLGRFLLFIGIPVSIISFLRKTDLSGAIVIAPITAWAAVLVGGGLAWIWIDLGLSDERFNKISRGVASKQSALSIDTTLKQETAWSGSTQGSFMLAMTMGNTAFMGYPVTLALAGQEYFVWALFYDVFGSIIALYSAGIGVASHYGSLSSGTQNRTNPLLSIAKTPALWSLPIGIGLKFVNVPPVIVSGMSSIAFITVSVSLVMLGMQLSQLTALRNIRKALTCLSIKMLLTPLVVGTGLMFFGITGKNQLAMVLQMGMPPAFATLAIAKSYNLDPDLTVTTLALGSVLLLFTIPIWLLLFG